VNNRQFVATMRAFANLRNDAASFEELRPACQVLILYEDFPAYSRAVELCRRVMERFAAELDFDIKCWSFIELADPVSARHATKTAGTTDIILLSMQTTRPPMELDRWLDFFFVSRFRAEGVLALVLNNRDNPPAEMKKLLVRLEQSAARLGMDFISLFSGDDAPLIPMPATIVRREARE
jgi:hypothetical protein